MKTLTDEMISIKLDSLNIRTSKEREDLFDIACWARDQTLPVPDNRDLIIEKQRELIEHLDNCLNVELPISKEEWDIRLKLYTELSALQSDKAEGTTKCKHENWVSVQKFKQCSDCAYTWFDKAEKEEHKTCDRCQMFSESGCMLDDSCPECVEHHLWTPKKEYTKCPTCNGTGVNHYDDNNNCRICHGEGVIEVVRESIEPKSVTMHDLNNADQAAECRECGHQNSENCNTCDILNPQFR